MSATEIDVNTQQAKWRASVPAGERNYPMNCWWDGACTKIPSMKTVVSSVRVRVFPDPAKSDSPEIADRFPIAHATTPIDATHMHYFWLLGRDHGTSAEQLEKLGMLTKKGFGEDEAMIEAVQRVMSRDPRPSEALEVSVRADSAGVQARRVVQRWMQRETA